MTERERFEQWASRNVGQPSFAGYYSEGAAWVYRHNIMDQMWRCWQAAGQAEEDER